MKTYIKSNVLNGPLYNLNKLLMVKEHREGVLKVLDYYLKRDGNVPIAIYEFANYVTLNLFGKKGGKILINKHNSLLGYLSGSRGVEYRFRKLLNQIIKRTLIYDPRTGKNNFRKLSGILIKDINNWLYEDPKLYEAMKNQVLTSGDLEEGYDITPLFVRKVLYFAIRSIIEGIALKWIDYGIQISKISNEIYKKHSKVGHQYRELRYKDLVGAILFRGMEFKPMLGPVLDETAHLKRVMRGINTNFSKWGTSWSADLRIAEYFANAQYHSFDDFKNETFKGYLKKLKYCKRGKICHVNCDKLTDIKKIIKHGIDNKDSLKMDAKIILSYPLIKTYNRKKVKEPLQMLISIGPYDKFESEVAFKPKSFRLTNNSIDANISFIKK